MVGKVHSNPMPPGWATHKLENNYIAEILPQKWELWVAHNLPSLEEEPPEHLDLKASGAWLQQLYRTGGNRDSTLGGRTQGLMHYGTQGKSSDSIGAWGRPTR